MKRSEVGQISWDLRIFCMLIIKPFLPVVGVTLHDITESVDRPEKKVDPGSKWEIKTVEKIAKLLLEIIRRSSQHTALPGASRRHG